MGPVGHRERRGSGRRKADREIAPRHRLARQYPVGACVTRADCWRGWKQKLGFARNKRHLATATASPAAFMRQTHAAAPGGFEKCFVGPGVEARPVRLDGDGETHRFVPAWGRRCPAGPGFHRLQEATSARCASSVRSRMVSALSAPGAREKPSAMPRAAFSPSGNQRAARERRSSAVSALRSVT